jgi:hypothetical protein
MSQESAGASRRVDPVEESAVCGDSGERASALENAAESRACSNVASGPTRAELLALVAAAIIALDAGKSEVARARLLALAEAVRPSVTLPDAGGEIACDSTPPLHPPSAGRAPGGFYFAGAG